MDWIHRAEDGYQWQTLTHVNMAMKLGPERCWEILERLGTCCLLNKDSPSYGYLVLLPSSYSLSSPFYSLWVPVSLSTSSFITIFSFHRLCPFCIFFIGVPSDLDLCLVSEKDNPMQKFLRQFLQQKYLTEQKFEVNK
jgi:hypothetical protein